MRWPWRSAKKTWIKTANELQNRITDEVIEKSIENLPSEIFEIRGEEIIRKLKTRRDDLEIYAEEYYDFISKIVTVFGSNKKDHFVIERINAEQTKVTVYLLKTKTEEINRKVYERTFNRSETKEIQLYGFCCLRSSFYLVPAQAPCNRNSLQGGLLPVQNNQWHQVQSYH